MISHLYSRFCLTMPAPEGSTGLLVAFSGGLDSTLLLVLAAQYAREHSLPLRALHVHHGLSPHADEWVAHCEAVCQQLAVELLVERVTLIRGNGESLEAQARTARYQRLTARMREGEWLLTAHHQDDQLETLLLALKRGAGLRGLAGILQSQPFAGGLLLRPLLDMSRAELAEAAASLPFGWVEDESNQDVSYDRNFLRQTLIPSSRRAGPPWPRPRHAAWPCAPSRRRCWMSLPRTTGSWRARGGAPYRPAARPFTYPAQQPAALLDPPSGGEMPSREQLVRLWQEVALARGDANPQLNWGRQSCRRFQERLYLVSPDLQPCHQVLPLTVGEPLPLPDGLGELVVRMAEHGEGLLRAPERTSRSRCAFRWRPGSPSNRWGEAVVGG